MPSLLPFAHRAGHGRILFRHVPSSLPIAHAATIPGILRADLVADLARGDTMNDAITRRWVHMLPLDLPYYAVLTLRPGCGGAQAMPSTARRTIPMRTCPSSSTARPSARG